MEREVWKAAFGPDKEPREVQVRAVEWWEAHAGEKLNVLEAPTGCGKSLLGSYLLYTSPRRGIYVCPTKILQSQLARESVKWPRWSDKVAGDASAPIVCLYGRGNYWDDRRLEHYMRETKQQRHVDILQRTCDAFANEQNASVPPRDLFDESCFAHGMCDQKERDELWCQVKSRKRGESEYDRRRVEARSCKMLIINSALFFSYLLHTQDVDLTKDTIVIDEGHALTESCDSLTGPDKPVDFNVSEAMELVRQYRKKKQPIADVEPIDELVRIRNDTLVFKHAAFSGALQTWQNRLDGGTLSKLISYLREVRKFSKRDSEDDDDGASDASSTDAFSDDTSEGNATEDVLNVEATDSDAKAEALVVLHAWKRSVELNMQDPFKAEMHALTSEERDDVQEVLTDRQRLVAFLKGVVRRVLENVAEADAALRLVLNTLTANAASDELCDVLKEAKRVSKVYDNVTIARNATCSSTWLESRRATFVPTLSNGDRTKSPAPQLIVEYTPTLTFVAKQLGEHLWDKIGTRVLVMSATIVNMQAPHEPFRLFLNEIGMATAATLRMDQVFDRERTVLVSPAMSAFPSFHDPDRTKKLKAFRDEQVHEILKAMQSVDAKKSVLVLGPTSNEEADQMFEYLSCQCPGRKHLKREDKKGLRAFCSALDSPPSVIYGGKTQTTGLDLPGRLGMVVLTRPPNLRWRQTRLDYHKLQGNEVLYNSVYTFKRDQLALQAAGRLQRTFDDSGVVLILGDDEKKTKLTVSETIRRAWGVCAVARSVQ